jgi:hypothetical protein
MGVGAGCATHSSGTGPLAGVLRSRTAWHSRGSGTSTKPVRYLGPVGSEDRRCESQRNRGCESRGPFPPGGPVSAGMAQGSFRTTGFSPASATWADALRAWAHFSLRSLVPLHESDFHSHAIGVLAHPRCLLPTLRLTAFTLPNPQEIRALRSPLGPVEDGRVRNEAQRRAIPCTDTINGAQRIPIQSGAQSVERPTRRGIRPPPPSTTRNNS